MFEKQKFALNSSAGMGGFFLWKWSEVYFQGILIFGGHIENDGNRHSAITGIVTFILKQPNVQYPCLIPGA